MLPRRRILELVELSSDHLEDDEPLRPPARHANDSLYEVTDDDLDTDLYERRAEGDLVLAKIVLCGARRLVPLDLT